MPVLGVQSWWIFQQELEKVKGEKFNVFSVLSLESNENKTHSAFLAELLNPSGSHLKGNLFLKYFLELIPDAKMDLNSTNVRLEKNIGERDDVNKTGGRIDIFLYDKDGNSISIENKIFASDQFAQIERYCNYNPAKNRVFYLNLFGIEPSIKSAGNKIVDQDFFIISYKHDVLQWLSKCHDEVQDSWILGATIKQYILLIQKLTMTMENYLEEDLVKMLLENCEEASIIEANLPNALKPVSPEITWVCWVKH